jgi:hypothetical protein
MDVRRIKSDEGYLRNLYYLEYSTHISQFTTTSSFSQSQFKGLCEKLFHNQTLSVKEIIPVWDLIFRDIKIEFNGLLNKGSEISLI